MALFVVHVHGTGFLASSGQTRCGSSLNQAGEAGSKYSTKCAKLIGQVSSAPAKAAFTFFPVELPHPINRISTRTF